MQVYGFDVFELLILASALIASGFIAGILAGLLGIGGGIILVPVLFQLFTFLKIGENIVMHLAVGTSIAIIVPTSFRSVKAHIAKQAVDMALLKTWLFPVLMGASIGAFTASYVEGGILKSVFATIAIFIGFKLLFGKESWMLSKDIPFGFVNNIIAAFIGFFSTLMGIGGGTLGVTYMTLCGRKIHQAIATSSGLGLLISVPATIGFIIAGWNVESLPIFSFGYVNLLGVMIMIPSTVIAAPLGVKLAHRFSRRRLELIFSSLLFLVAIRLIYSMVS